MRQSFDSGYLKKRNTLKLPSVFPNTCITPLITGISSVTLRALCQTREQGSCHGISQRIEAVYAIVSVLGDTINGTPCIYLHTITYWQHNTRSYRAPLWEKHHVKSPSAHETSGERHTLTEIDIQGVPFVGDLSITDATGCLGGCRASVRDNAVVLR